MMHKLEFFNSSRTSYSQDYETFNYGRTQGGNSTVTEVMA